MSWLANLLEYTHPQESPELFHLWGGITTIAAILGRRVWTPRRSLGTTWYNIYPGQMMVVLVAPSGRGHKSVPIRMARRMMEKHGVHTIKGKGSAEKILKELSMLNGTAISGGVISQKPPDAIATIIAPELSVLLSKQTYAEALVDFLTDIFDAEDKFEYLTHTHGKLVLNNPCVTFLGGTNPVSLGESIPEKAQQSGYQARVIHVYHSGIEKEENALIDLNDQEVDPAIIARQTQLLSDLDTGLATIRGLSGPFTYTAECARLIKAWNRDWNSNPRWQGEGYPTRRLDHTLRVSMILRISESLSLSHDTASWEAADLLMQKVENDFPLAFSHIGRSTLGRKQDRILSLIAASGGKISAGKIHHGLYRYFNDIDELRIAMRTLQEAGMIIHLGATNNVEFWGLGPNYQP